MARVSTIADIQWRLVQFLAERLDKICSQDAFADARRVQAARLGSHQVGSSFDGERIALPREGQNAAIGGWSWKTFIRLGWLVLYAVMFLASHWRDSTPWLAAIDFSGLF